MLKFDANDIKNLEENTKQKLILVENTYKGSLFKADIKNKTLNKDKLKIINIQLRLIKIFREVW